MKESDVRPNDPWVSRWGKWELCVGQNSLLPYVLLKRGDRVLYLPSNLGVSRTITDRGRIMAVLKHASKYMMTPKLAFKALSEPKPPHMLRNDKEDHS